MSKIREHFDQEAHYFDGLILQMVPFYKEMVDSLICALHFKSHKAISVVDIGCGTGTITGVLKERYPKAAVTCIDFSANMIEQAKKKLSKFKDISYVVGDMNHFRFKGKSDAVVSSLALHHIPEVKDKKALYKKVYNNLKPGGCFYIYDVILGEDEYLQSMYMGKWKDFIQKNTSFEQMEKILHTYKEEDRPFKLLDEIKMLNASGFKKVHIICKLFNSALYGGIK